MAKLPPTIVSLSALCLLWMVVPPLTLNRGWSRPFRTAKFPFPWPFCSADCISWELLSPHHWPLMEADCDLYQQLNCPPTCYLVGLTELPADGCTIAVLKIFRPHFDGAAMVMLYSRIQISPDLRFHSKIYTWLEKSSIRPDVSLTAAAETINKMCLCARRSAPGFQTWMQEINSH